MSLLADQRVDLNKLKTSCLDLSQVTEETPFGPEVLVYKVLGKMFALTAWEDDPVRLTLKSDPDEAQVLRGLYSAIQPGYHMNKEHWNTITLDGTVPDAELLRMIQESYKLVVQSLKKSDRERLIL